jgi:septal ring factor EnvC (AmiA/AmiB activator)
VRTAEHNLALTAALAKIADLAQQSRETDKLIAEARKAYGARSPYSRSLKADALKIRAEIAEADAEARALMAEAA